MIVLSQLVLSLLTVVCIPPGLNWLNDELSEALRLFLLHGLERSYPTPSPVLIQIRKNPFPGLRHHPHPHQSHRLLDRIPKLYQ